MENNDKKIKIIVRDLNGTELLRKTYPDEYLIGVFSDEVIEDGWHKAEVLFSNFTDEKISKMKEQIKCKEL